MARLMLFKFGKKKTLRPKTGSERMLTNSAFAIKSVCRQSPRRTEACIRRAGIVLCVSRHAAHHARATIAQKLA